MAADPRTLAELFEDARYGLLAAREDFRHHRDDGTRNPPCKCAACYSLAALDAIAERQHETKQDDEEWTCLCRCHPGSKRDRVEPHIDPDCLALRAACKGGKG